MVKVEKVCLGVKNKRNYGGKMRRIILTLLITLIASMPFVFAFEYEPGHIIIRLHDDIRGNERNNFVTAFSEYEMREETILSDSLAAGIGAGVYSSGLIWLKVIYYVIKPSVIN
jgi:uncharacterized protein (DUF2062 family)